jgi:hypothetical protein
MPEVTVAAFPSAIILDIFPVKGYEAGTSLLVASRI